MPSGSCLCGASKIFVLGEPSGVVTCHCRDCRKISGSVYSVNWVVPSTSVSVDGHSLSSVAVTAGSGNRITGYFCGACGTTLYRASEGVPGFWFVKAGVLDGEAALAAHPPAGESFVGTRVGWVPKLKDVQQATGHCQL